MSALAILFWLCIAGVFYIYAGYPMLIGISAHLFPKPVKKVPNNYSVSVIISIYNEAPRITAKLHNILSVEGSERIVQILIGSDGSNDSPEQAIQDMNDPRIKLVSFPERRGKPSILNDLIPMATGDILIMMDVRQRLDQKAVPALLENFSDSTIGVVSGELVFERTEADTSAAEGIDAYWRYEKWIRDREGRFDSVPGATGALYAIRRELAKPIPAEAALDDVILPMQAIAQGYRCIFESSAKIYDRPSQDSAQEAIRKRRTLAGCVQLLRLRPSWSLPFGHPIWWQYTSHKIIRLFSPLLLIGAFSLSIVIASHNLMYGLLAAGQLLFYLLGTWGLCGKETKMKLLRVLSEIISVFLLMQLALLVGWKNGLSRPNLALWQKSSDYTQRY